MNEIHKYFQFDNYNVHWKKEGWTSLFFRKKIDKSTNCYVCSFYFKMLCLFFLIQLPFGTNKRLTNFGLFLAINRNIPIAMHEYFPEFSKCLIYPKSLCHIFHMKRISHRKKWVACKCLYKLYESIKVSATVKCDLRHPWCRIWNRIKWLKFGEKAGGNITFVKKKNFIKSSTTEKCLRFEFIKTCKRQFFAETRKFQFFPLVSWVWWTREREKNT